MYIFIYFCSDHAMSRCLFYGFKSIPIGFPCIHSYLFTTQQLQVHKQLLQDNIIYMCGHISYCNISTHLSCHRWKPISRINHLPERTYLTSSNTTEWVGCRPGKYK